MVLLFRSNPPMRYASAKRRVQGNPLRMTIVHKTKTSSVILKILKILIQDQVTAGEYYIETYRGEDASIASLLGIQKPDELDDLTLGTHCFVIREMYLY